MLENENKQVRKSLIQVLRFFRDFVDLGIEDNN
jgi:hypothetical protein